MAGSDSGNHYGVSEREKKRRVCEHINRLTAPEEHIRSHAALALGNFNDRGAVAFLINALRNDASGIEALCDQGQEVRSMAAVALFVITGVNYGEDYERWSQWWDEYR